MWKSDDLVVCVQESTQSSVVHKAAGLWSEIVTDIDYFHLNAVHILHSYRFVVSRNIEDIIIIRFLVNTCEFNNQVKNNSIAMGSLSRPIILLSVRLHRL